MRIEPVPTLVGHLAVPGNKSISHRAVLIAAICEGETQDRGVRALCGHGGDSRRGCARSGRTSRTTSTRCGSRASESAGCARRPGRSTAGMRARSCACSPASLRARRGGSSSWAMRRSRLARWNESPSRSTRGAAWAGRRRNVGRGRPRALRRRWLALRDRLRASPGRVAQVKWACSCRGYPGRWTHHRRRRRSTPTTPSTFSSARARRSRAGH